ncbi:hypothetical protein DICPUDRAFT_151801 [Dictyostelium purpureum]|uniref:Serine protease n=1 Tax=Dictyostelium purpureum TaxID=5786 RepID=F0ZJS1_DICPU|nr:uncharacterized protein DICPUDRAFT_151801 [Dictyostelium purpureum]EGC35830.1 hypothetical protein DICPUDRAFT_151801 [Dictyostelium purpureum]|eukprot:XP_003287667.1 hypothetical protein DICPUDRAFT_151801 [Dictyostelium purpureum]
MKLLLLLVLVSCLLNSAYGVFKTPFGKNRERLYREQLGEVPVFSNQTFWFDQKIDHYDFFNNNTYKQQYIVVDDYFDGSGPIFIYLAGEAPMGFFGFQEVQVVEWAKQFGALFIVIEHRFYGKSYPTQDLSTNNLKYLTSQQALADAANFLSTYKAENDLVENPTVVFGCSYSGALSSWFRLKYPQLAIASIAPSGPVLAQLNFTGYYAQFSNSAAPNCVQAAQTATNQIMQLTKSSAGIKQLEKTFNSCHSLENPRDLYYFLYTLTEALGSADQMNNPPTWILNSTCGTFLQNDNLLTNWAQIVNAGQTGCNDYRLSTFIEQMREIKISQQDGSRSWVYQTCVEFGYFSTTYEGTSVFPPTLNVEEQVKWCEEIFDVPGMTPNIDWTNAYYGGQNTQATNVMFTNGLLDPWHLLSVNSDNEAGTVRAATYEAGHCASLIQETSEDPISLVNAREEVVSFLKGVLSN